MDPGPNQPVEGDRAFEDLLVRYWDGTLDERGMAELNAALTAQPELRAVFNDLCWQTLAISERFAAEEVCPPASSPRFRIGRRQWLAGSAVAAGLLVTAGLKALKWWPFGGPVDADGTAVAQLEDATGDVCIVEPDGERRPLARNQSVRAGQVIATVGESSSARIRCADGMPLVLGGNTSAAVLDRNIEKIRFDTGSLAAGVPARPEGRPLRIVTPAKSEVLARRAKLSLQSSGAEMRVVHLAEPGAAGTGAVHLKRLSDGQSVPIQPGQWLVAHAEGDLRPETLLRTPDTWQVQFGPQPPRPWGVGELVLNDLPEGSQGAMRAKPYRTAGGASFHKVVTHNAWTNGLFVIHEDSWLHVRFRVEKRGFFHCLVVARDPDATKRASVVLEENRFWANREPGRWYTVHIPFAHFHPTRPEAQIEKPLIAFIVLFDSQKADIGLTIERFWISRGAEVH